MAPINTGKEKSFLRRKWAQFYTERQIYLRSHGQVQFISFSPLAQLALVTATLLLFGWVAFASVNVVFKDLIIYTTNAKSRTMQSAYEERLAGLMVAYEELQGKLIETERSYETATENLEEKHRKLVDLLAAADAANAEIEALRREYDKAGMMPKNAAATDKQAALRGNRVLMPLRDAQDRPHLARLESKPDGQRAEAEAGAPSLFSRLFGAEDATTPARYQRGQPDTALAKRMAKLSDNQQILIDRLEQETETTLQKLTAVVSMTHALDAPGLIQRAQPEGLSVGGPFEALDTEDLSERILTAPDAFDRQVYRLVARLEELAILEAAVSKLPLAVPLRDYRMTSRFGPRTDPFNRRVAFHAGLDFAARYGAPVHATVAGKVIYAGWRGGYGRFVEIESANGLTTRFAHLSAINVEEGDDVEFQQVIGKLGNSGRSSGPHLHYEVRIDGEAYDPENFINAGHYVFAQS